MLAGLCSFLEALEERLFPCLLQLLEAAHIPWLKAPSSISKVSSVGLISSRAATLPSLFCLPLLRTLMIKLGPPR